MLTLLGTWINENTHWLYTKVYENELFFFDLWSLVHVTAGFLLFALLRRSSSRHPWPTLAALLVSYELIELGFIYVAFDAFRPETIKDQVTDVLVGLGGGLAFAWLSARVRSTRTPDAAQTLSMGFVPVAMAYLWVGQYGYRYNAEVFNSPGLNWFAFALWSAVIAAILLCFTTLARAWRSRVLGLAVTAVLYVVVGFGGEALAYGVLGIHEVGHPGAHALAFGLVHGTSTMFGFYLSVPFTAVAILHVTRWFFEGALKAEQQPIPRGELASLVRVS